MMRLGPELKTAEDWERHRAEQKKRWRREDWVSFAAYWTVVFGLLWFASLVKGGP